MNIGLIISCVLSCIIFKLTLDRLKMEGIILDNIDLTTIIITLSMISIYTFKIIINMVDRRILGLSYKKLFFNDSICKYFNFSNFTFILMEIMFFSVIIGIPFKRDEAENNAVFSNFLDYILNIKCVMLIVIVSLSIFYMSMVSTVN